MRDSWMSRRYWLGLAVLVVLSLGSAKAIDLDSTAVSYKLPNQIKWTGDPNGPAETAILQGDPMKEGELYIELIKWHPHHMSRPHFHPNARYITVLSGTWWVGTGTKYDPDATVPMPAGSYVVDLPKGIHYDGAKDDEAVIEIVGLGPATMTPAEAK